MASLKIRSTGYSVEYPYAPSILRALSAIRDAANGVTVRVVTVAGATGARGGYIDPEDARQKIIQAVGAADTEGSIAALEIVLKVDSSPPVFNDRLIGTGCRVWLIRHGVDNFGALERPAPKRSPTFIDPDCSANRRLLAAILGLRNAGV